MNFDLTPDQQQLQARVRDFAQAEVAPVAEKLDRDGVFRRRCTGSSATSA
jgi:alkylation response protein AidB-like acyl-CoA dehydrogenase